MASTSGVRRCVAGLVCAGLMGSGAFAGSLTWNVAGGGTWDTAAANWIGTATTFADTGTGVDNVTFNNTAGGTINIATNMTPLSTTVSATLGTYTFSGGPIDGGALIKSGAGMLDLRDMLANGFSSITLGGGTVRFDQRQPTTNYVNQLGSGTITVSDNSTLSYAYDNGAGGQMGGGSVSNPMTIANGKVMTLKREFSSHYLSYDGLISGLGGLRIEGSAGNQWTISNAANSFSGGVTVAGVVTFSNDGAFGGNSTITGESGTLKVSGTMGIGKTLSLTGSIYMVGGQWNGVVQGNTFGLSMSDGTLGLNNASNSQASTFNNIGTLRIGVPGSLGAGQLGYTSNPNNFLEFFDPVGGTFSNAFWMGTGDNRTLKVENAGATINWTGPITGSGGVTRFVYKDGPGTFSTTDWQANYSISIRGGRLLMNDPVTSGMGNVTVQTGGTLGGTGQISLGAGNTVTVAAGGTLGPGASAGTLSVVGTTTVASGGSLYLEFGGIPASGQFDKLLVTGLLDLSATGDILNITTLPTYYSNVGDTFHVLNYTTRNGAFDLLQWNGWTTTSVFSVAYDTGGGADLTFLVSIPEPASGLFLALAGLALLRRRR